MREKAACCHWCRFPVVQGAGSHPWPLNAATVDHVVPRKYGGSNLAKNLVVACRSCNELRGHTMPKAWRAWLLGDGAEWAGIPPEERGRPIAVAPKAKRARTRYALA